MLKDRCAATIRLIKLILRNRHHRRLIEPLFDDNFYLSRYQDVKEAGIDPRNHYLQHGWREGRWPSAEFDTSWYMQQNPDVTESGYNPLIHYILHGRSEGRSAVAPLIHYSNIQAQVPLVNISKSSAILQRFEVVRRSSALD